jgi:hypothetical protein
MRIFVLISDVIKQESLLIAGASTLLGLGIAYLLDSKKQINDLKEY